MKLDYCFSDEANKDMWIGLINPGFHLDETRSSDPAIAGILEWVDGTTIVSEPSWFPDFDLNDGLYCMRIMPSGNGGDKECFLNLAFACQFDCNNPAGRWTHLLVLSIDWHFGNYCFMSKY